MAYDAKRVEAILDDVVNELWDAMGAFPPFHSAHEGYAVIKEELDELWELVRSKDGTRARMREEAMQVAAMAMRFMYDLEEPDGQ